LQVECLLEQGIEAVQGGRLMAEVKFEPFEVTIKLQMSVRYEHDMVMLNLAVSSPSVLDEEGKEISTSFGLPIPFLSSGADAEQQADRACCFNRGHLPITLLLLSGSAFRFLGNCYFIEEELLTATFADAVRVFQKDVAADVREMVGLPKRGNPSKWRPEELLARVQGMVKKKPAISWEEINDALKKTDPDKASKNGRALQEVARTLGIGIRKVRSQMRKRRMKNR